MRVDGPIVALLLGLAAVPVAAQQAPVTSSGPCPVQEGLPCMLTLHGPAAPAASAQCTSSEWASRLRFPQRARWADSDKDGFFESVVELRLDPVRDCGCVVLRAELADEISAWVLHVGGSPTNDGYGGDMGTTPFAAELYVRDRNLSAYSAPHSGTRIDRILDAALPQLSGKILVVEICDQRVEVELGGAGALDPLRLRLETHTSKQLFHLGPDGDGDGAGSGPASIWAAFNRVVHNVGGAPSHGRTGRGVQRVEISLVP